MEFEITENGYGASLRDIRLVRAKRASDPGTGVRAITILEPVDGTQIPILTCDIYHFLASLPVDLKGYDSFLAGVFSARPIDDGIRHAELLIAGWDDGSTGQGLC